MHDQEKIKLKYPFIPAVGTTAELIRNYPWEKTLLGVPDGWPQALKTFLGTMLKVNSPVYVAWGKEFIQFYNDAFLAVAGKIENVAIGESAAKNLSEKWSAYNPFFEKAWHGETIASGKFLNGSFDFSPIFIENDEVDGVLATASEAGNWNARKLEQATVFHDVIMQSPVPVTIFRGKEFVIEMANRAMFQEIWRKSADEVIGRKLLDVFPEMKGQKYPELLHHVMETGAAYRETESMVLVTGNDGEKIFYMDYEYAPLFDDEHNVSGILITANDVSEKVQARKMIEESETRQKIAIESAEIGTFDWDIVHSGFIFSERLARIFGYANTEGLSQSSFSDLIHPDDAAMRRKAHKESFRTGTLFYEARFIKSDEIASWIRVNGKVFFDENGFPQRMYGTVLDITPQKVKTYALEKEVSERMWELQAKNEELKRSEERYHRMTDEVQDYAIILLDRQGTILNWNKGAQKIKGYSEKDILGKNFNIFYRPEDKQNKLPEKLIDEAIRSGRAVHEGWRVRKDKTVFWGSIVITALHDEEGNVIAFSKVTRDLTERKVAEDRMKQYASELEFQNKELEQFAFVASHDLQEPLRKIQTFTSMLQNNIENREIAEIYLNKVKSSAERMTQLIKAVLNYSRLSKAALETEEVDLNVLLENILVDFELLIFEKGAKVIFPELPVIQGYSLQLTQLFSNLIGNSLKFVEKTPVIEITSRVISEQEIVKYPELQTGDTYLELVFSDNGIGFEKQYASQIFDMFQRLHDKQLYSGTGIGLALCKRIVENHHGFITASSEPGQGAKFFIYIPV